MADPMWTGGAQQFADWAPWIWSIMGDWAKEPFYPDDPPKDPGAFTAQAMVVTNMPALGTVYSPFIVEYCIYYQQQWDASPPATSSAVPALPTLPASPSPDYGSTYDWKGLYTILYGAVSDVYGLVNQVKGVVDLILDRLPGGSTPPLVASHTEQARTLAAIYYTNWLWFNSPPPVSVPDVLDAIDTAHTATDGLINGLATNTQNAFQVVGEDLEELLGAVQSIEPEVPVPPVYPGLGGITQSSPVSVDTPQRIAGTMDGILYTVNTVPSGQSTQPVGSRTRLKGIAWAAFEGDDGKLEPRQSMELDAGILVTQSLAHASAVVVYCKPGAQITVTPWSVA
jgi:hypothetical protein